MFTRTYLIKLKLTLSMLLLAVMLGQAVLAQGSSAPEISGPIDIQANEQEFAGEQVIARGNVHVTYKDSVIVAPVATLYRDAQGSPQRAVFTGHPKLVQDKSSIDADTIVFEIANQKVLAEGNAHSEVVSTQSASEKIITDSDRQEYEKTTDKFEATGHVRVKHQDIAVSADKLRLVYGTNKKPETAIFTGHVTATQNQNRTSADTITYSLITKRLQASGHVKSQVIQKADGQKKRNASLSPANQNFQEVTAYQFDGQKNNQEDPIVITSDSQDYSKESGRLAADGNVRIYYQDTVGMGPKVVVVRNDEGKAEKVVFHGRSQVSQPGRRWIADRITLTVADKKVLAEGNTKAIILQGPGQRRPAGPGYSDSRLAGRASTMAASKIEATQ
ncbi:MAG: hypothetical protein HY711_10700 [Candidatus Melainabacteria bacterium]|nr:hypothetical protein [Candidatus Melainabacteria bacterium]